MPRQSARIPRWLAESLRLIPDIHQGIGLGLQRSGALRELPIHQRAHHLDHVGRVIGRVIGLGNTVHTGGQDRGGGKGQRMLRLIMGGTLRFA